MADYYIDFDAGDDTNNGTSTATPWEHCPGDSNASDSADITLSAGDRVIFKGGVTYTGTIASNQNGTDGTEIIFDGDSGEYVTRWGGGTDKAAISGQITISHDYCIANNISFSGNIGIANYYIEITGDYNEVSYCLFTGTVGLDVGHVQLNGNHNTVSYSEMDTCSYRSVEIWQTYNTVEYCEFHDFNNDVFRVFGHDHIIRHNEIYDLTETGYHTDFLQTYGDLSDVAYDVLIDSNYMHDCSGNVQIGNFTQDGVSDQRDWTFINNIFTDVGSTAWVWCPGYAFYNNTFVRVGDVYGNGAIYLRSGAAGDAENCIIKNNFFVDCGDSETNNGWYTKDAGVASLDADYNYVTNSSFGSKSGFVGVEVHGINGGDPKFTDYDNSDFHLESDSPAIGEGINLSGTFTDDYDGITRAAWDIGAYEYDSGAPPETGGEGPFAYDLVMILS